MRIGIVGGGISGLSLGWYLSKQLDKQVTVFEASSRVGGWIQSENGFEQGPRSCRTAGNGIYTLELAKELGIEDSVQPASPDAKKRYIWKDGQLQELPNSLGSLVRSPFCTTILKGLWRDFWTGKSVGQKERDESIGDFFRRRFGDKITECFVDPMVTGIYAGDKESLSVESCFSQIVDFERSSGSVIRGAFRKKRTKHSDPFIQKMLNEPIFSFTNGMQTLPESLLKKLSGCENVRVSTGSKVKGLIANEDGTLTLQVNEKQKFLFDHVVLACPARVSAELLQSVQPDASSLLTEIPTASVGVVNLGWKSNVLKNKGFGYLIPSSEKETILGCVWDSSVFPNKQNKHQTILSVMMGGVKNLAILNEPDEKKIDVALDSIKRHLKILSPPDSINVQLAGKAIPQYVLGHSSRLKKICNLIKNKQKNISLLGCSYYGVAVNDCIAQSYGLANRFAINGTAF